MFQDAAWFVIFGCQDCQTHQQDGFAQGRAVESYRGMESVNAVFGARP